MIDFPQTPTINQEYSYQGQTWIWAGYAWKKVIQTSGGGFAFTLRPYPVYPLLFTSLEIKATLKDIV